MSETISKRGIKKATAIKATVILNCIIRFPLLFKL